MRAKRALECGREAAAFSFILYSMSAAKAAASQPHSKGFASFGKTMRH
jgi:hypothetical protein